jgi:ADP-heptose:LPS heptosyltransferase
MKRMIFKQWQAPGDLLMLSVAIRDLHSQYSNMFETDVFSCYPEVFFNNPYLTYFPKNDGFPVYDLKYAEARDYLAPEGCHFSDAFIYLLNNMFGLSIIKTSMRPDIYLTPDEKSENILERLEIKKPYWIINSGIKQDIPIKGYPPAKWEIVINDLTAAGLNLYQVGSKNHLHPIHNGIRSLIGKTENLRDFFSLVYHSEGSIGHVSMHMHVAAAFNKPCIVIAGGREDHTWEQYPDHSYIHMIGALDCCKHRGCWVSTAQDCENLWENSPYAQCLVMISPNQIVNEVLKYCR